MKAYDFIVNLLERMTTTHLVIGVIAVIIICIIGKFVKRAFWRGLFK